MHGKIVFVVNPKSANGDTGRAWRAMAERIRSAVGDFGELFTSGSMEAERLAHRALSGGADIVVAVGGDGTVNEVANGFFDNGKPVHGGSALAVLPCGTGGDFRKTFNWTNKVDDFIARIRAARVRPLDVGRVDFTAHDGVQQARYFVNIASFGTSGLVDRYVNTTSKALGGKASFLVASLRAMRAYEDRRCLVRFDDGEWEELNVTCLAVANGQYFGGGMRVAPEARPDDGVFDVTIWSGYKLHDFILKSRRIYDGTHTKMKGTRTLRARKIEATCEEECLLDVDGEAPGRLPATFEILPGAIGLVV